jgi:hypothetical protein
MREPREIIREEPLWHASILAAVSGGPQTVPQIAETIGRPANEVLYWVMGMRRYDKLVESGDADADGYFRYGVKR